MKLHFDCGREFLALWLTALKSLKKLTQGSQVCLMFSPDNFIIQEAVANLSGSKVWYDFAFPEEIDEDFISNLVVSASNPNNQVELTTEVDVLIEALSACCSFEQVTANVRVIKRDRFVILEIRCEGQSTAGPIQFEKPVDVIIEKPGTIPHTQYQEFLMCQFDCAYHLQACLKAVPSSTKVQVGFVSNLCQDCYEEPRLNELPDYSGLITCEHALVGRRTQQCGLLVSVEAEGLQMITFYTELGLDFSQADRQVLKCRVDAKTLLDAITATQTIDQRSITIGATTQGSLVLQAKQKQVVVKALCSSIVEE
mmetsp:Transcript_26068/g.46282  ORF Transcript_26068/g.46282 Transcript_26068/m.46282 type:complete len:311 (+) Transcript_26068:1465-2397(+)|eukprot:CAMPEP_0204912882 /NCGR_PEP_ID=MMETSP1397-20131031/10958_1 /ASSEMBLY_ACC=CAM_ASM_000891 /TAXON_ID=49980 /ORGANISM="Climacostomum Climacostomum virens, Strain Stock W-24" /LENGTH=310 /DNA_ID=CAMNT_0052084001 /DNA_START=41 /DNA_END=973 /DNA_ORIENTATION=+